MISGNAMKKDYRSAAIFSAFAVVLTLATVSFAQKVGGYETVAKTDPGVVAAADFAVQAQSGESEKGYQLEEIVKAERQVVQGSNYRLCLEVSADGSDTFFVQAVVYVDLKGNRKLTSWVDSKCGESATTPVSDPLVLGKAFYHDLKRNSALFSGTELEFGAAGVGT